MAIEREGSDFHVCCDLCPATDGPYPTFEDALVAKQTNGNWKSKQRNGEWEDLCKECQQAYNKTNVRKKGKKIQLDLGGKR